MREGREVKVEGQKLSENVMKYELINKLSKFSEEEQNIYSNQESSINKNYYTSQSEFVIEQERFLNDKLIEIRKHPRFVSFPKHKHDFIEINYVLTGCLNQSVEGNQYRLKAGELMLLNQHVEHELDACQKDDLIVNFIINPVFFDHLFKDLPFDISRHAIGNFLVNGLFNPTKKGDYLYYQVKHIESIQDKIYEMIMELLTPTIFSQSKLKFQMGLLLIELADHAECALSKSTSISDNHVIIQVLNKIDSNFKDIQLKKMANQLHMSNYQLSKLIKKMTGKTFKELLQERRIHEAKILLLNHEALIEDVAHEVGYENISYFYRLFNNFIGMTPREFRREAIQKS